MARPKKYERRVFKNLNFEAKTLEEFEKIMMAEGRSISRAIADFMEAYTADKKPKISNTTLEKWQTNENYRVTPAIFDKSSVWQNYKNGCSNKDLLELIDQLDALKYSHQLTLAMRRSAESKKTLQAEAEIKKKSTYETKLSNADVIIEEVFNRVIEAEKAKVSRK
jgi:hypothetical protein